MTKLTVRWSAWRVSRRYLSPTRPSRLSGTLELIPSLHDLRAVDAYIKQHIEIKILADELEPGTYKIRWWVQQKARFNGSTQINPMQPVGNQVNLQPGQIYFYGENNWIRIDKIDQYYIRGYGYREDGQQVIEGEFILPLDGRVEPWLIDQQARLVMTNLERCDDSSFDGEYNN